jgi:hypothetical protein
MRRGFPYETSITSKKEGEISVESRILRSVTMSRDTGANSDLHWIVRIV